MEPEEIEGRQFGTSLRGYDRQQVEDFAAEIAEHVRRLQADLASARNALEAARSVPPPPVSPPPPPSPEASPSRAKKSDAYKQLGEETARILITAEQAAEEIRERAKREAAEVLADARRHAGRIAREAREGKQQAEADLRQLLHTREMLAGQLEDVRRRLAEPVARLQAPLEPARPTPVEKELPDVLPALDGPQAVPEPAGPKAADIQPKPPAPETAGPKAQPSPEKTAEAPSSAAEKATDQIPAGSERSRGSSPPALQPGSRAPRPAPEPVQALGDLSSGPAPEHGRAAAERSPEKTTSGSVPSSPQKASRPVTELRPRPAAPAAAGPDPPQPAQPPAPSPPSRSARPAAGRPHLQAAPPAASADERSRNGPEAPSPSADAPRKTAQGSGGKSNGTTLAPTNGSGRKPAPSGDVVELLLQEIREDTGQSTSPAQSNPAPAGEVPSAARPRPSSVPESELPGPAPAATSQSRREALFKDREAALGESAYEAARKLKRLLQEDHNDLLHRLRSQRGKGSVEQNMAPEDEQLERFTRALRQVLENALDQGRRQGGARPEGDAAGFVSSLVARQVVLPLRADLCRVVQNGLAAQDTPTSISERASDVFRIWKGVRTELLGEGLVLAAFHQGLLDAWKGKKSAKRWVLSSEEQECPRGVCQANVSEGPVPVGSHFSSGHASPPAHGGCTCGLQPS